MSKMPNIVFILIDDLGWRDIGCYGSSFYETPNIDRLAQQGMLFTDAYASCPVCSPTRASVLTGKYPARVGITQFIGGHTVGKLCDVPYFHQLPMQERSLAATLRNNGYQTWHVGKWHLGKEVVRHGFDANFGGCEWGHPWNGYFSPWGIPTLNDGPEGEYLTDRLTDESIRLIENRDKDRPFFLNFWPYAVHIPIQAPEHLVEKYRAKAHDMGLDTKESHEIGDYYPCQHLKEKRIRRRIIQSSPKYAAMVETLDTNIGKLLASLKANGLEDDTIVVFTSDNGGEAVAGGAPTCNAPLAEGKGWMYEGGTREPLIVRWPEEIASGTRCSVPTTSTDFYPTLLEAAGIPLMPQQHCDGVSILPLLKGKTKLDREAIFWHYPHYSNQGETPGSSVRAGDFKLIEYFEDGRLELYNLATDIGEEHNLVDTMPEKTRELHQQLIAWRESIKAAIPEPNPNWE